MGNWCELEIVWIRKKMYVEDNESEFIDMVLDNILAIPIIRSLWFECVLLIN